MMKRREFFGIAAALPTVAMADLSGVKSRQVSKWEIIYKSPHAKPNDLSMRAKACGFSIRAQTVGCRW